MNTYIKQAWSLVNEYFHSNAIDPSKLVDHELVRGYLKACQKTSPKGIRITNTRNRLNLRFKTATKSGNSDIACNEDFTRDGCVNALAKSLAVSDKLKELESESEFWEWYEVEVKGVKPLENDIITIGEAIELVKSTYLSGYDKCGRDRRDPKLSTSVKGKYHSAYGKHHQKLNPELRLTAENLISEIKRNWGQLIINTSGSQTLCSKGFKHAYNGVLKLLRDTRLITELDKVQSHFGTLRVVKKTEQQDVDLETFLDFRARVLGLNGYELTKSQLRYLGSRQSWFKAVSINLLYGFRCSEFKAILNLDRPVTIDGEYFPALSDPNNEWHEIVLDDGFWVTDTNKGRHFITIKTSKRICTPMAHPDYPNLLELLDIKNPEVKLPDVTPKASSKPETMERCYVHGMREALNRYIDQVGMGFTQTHALRHLANYHGIISGLTVDQRSASLGHSTLMNDTTYKGHQSIKNKRGLLRRKVSKESEIAELKAQLQHAQETILFLKKENARLREQLWGNDDIPRIGE
ncbi:hypothetical protein PMG71_02610 [Roseofilum sp. BLCC_M154]|uniref:Tyr recombinase domain-containing protein n=1 Tax=Roseofilum acuticapitatum BLCC-M154 TaxID=3022444 RepID=A0ABT7AN39_9CYAN|nr:hypothetical protein [Roseofilum acuticapitatum]MDJ1168313.1 hypothetical protein [Roseofilum acuticapitatum BLCC-M154]